MPTDPQDLVPLPLPNVVTTPVILSKVTGSASAFLQHQSYDYDPTRGYVLYQVYKGLSQQNGIGNVSVIALQNAFAAAGVANRLLYDQNGITILETVDSTQTFVLDFWQLVGNEEIRDQFTHPTITAMGLSTKDLNILRTNAQNPPDDMSWAQIYATMDDTTHGTVLQRFFDLYVSGATGYERAQYVLRHTSNVPNVGGPNISQVGVDMVYSTSKLLTEIGSGWQNNCPNFIQYQISNAPIPASVSNFLVGWLKKSPTSTLGAHNRIEVQQDYVYEQWSTDDYSIF